MLFCEAEMLCVTENEYVSKSTGKKVKTLKISFMDRAGEIYKDIPVDYRSGEDSVKGLKRGEYVAMALRYDPADRFGNHLQYVGYNALAVN